MKLEEATTGQRVTYSDGIKTEHGKVTSKNQTYIFVRFDNSRNVFGIACDPNYLKLEIKGEQESFDGYEEDNATDLEEALDILLNE